MMRKVKKLNWDRATFAPFAEEAVVNLDDISRIEIDDRTRRTEPCVRLTFRDGGTMQCLGKPEDFLE